MDFVETIDWMERTQSAAWLENKGCSLKWTLICSLLFAAERFKGSLLTLEKRNLGGNSRTC